MENPTPVRAPEPASAEAADQAGRELVIRIAEIFHSIQGEGFHAGTPAIFIRGAGCNLACDFCDTDFSPRETLSPSRILERIAGFPCRFVVLTGGEPTIQARGFRALVAMLRGSGYYVTMETNGTSLDTLGVDWVTVSPKLSQKGNWALRRAQELKLVYESQDLGFYEESAFDHYYLQPKEIRTGKWGGGERDEAATRSERDKTVAAVMANPRWKLSIQLHKELGLR